ncbi:MAG: GYD domain-containing protein [Solirubrobacterales bacterium]|nr:GYD domain-containing protein [Solirubrobacterales bacterium]MBV8942985.1 GYD domain-containing protein [Solirubrobacterales bacterium]
MATYIALIDWTDKGVQNFKDSVDRYEAAEGQLRSMGVEFKSIYWTLGAHDIVSIIEAPDDQTLAAGLLAVAGQGNIRTTTLRAFSTDEMRGVISKAS